MSEFMHSIRAKKGKLSNKVIDLVRSSRSPVRPTRSDLQEETVWISIIQIDMLKTINLIVRKVIQKQSNNQKDIQRF